MGHERDHKWQALACGEAVWANKRERLVGSVKYEEELEKEQNAFDHRMTTVGVRTFPPLLSVFS